MKQTSLQSFVHCINQAADAAIYGIISSESVDREEALAALLKKLGNKNVRTFYGAKLNTTELLQELHAYSFFEGKRVIVVRHLNEAPKAAIKQLEDYLATPHADVHLILEASEINRATTVYKLIEKNGIVLDIPEQKPWEKQRSIEEWLTRQYKSLAPDAIQLLLQQVGTDAALLQKEVEKLDLYTEGKRQITVADVRTVCGSMNTQTIWQLGDCLFKGNKGQAVKIAQDLLEDGTPFFSLIRALRTQFQTKYQICSLLQTGGTPLDVATHFPYMKGRILEQNCQMAQAYGMEQFHFAILLIDETEALAKSQTQDERLLVERLIGRL